MHPLDALGADIEAEETASERTEEHHPLEDVATQVERSIMICEDLRVQCNTRLALVEGQEAAVHALLAAQRSLTSTLTQGNFAATTTSALVPADQLRINVLMTRQKHMKLKLDTSDAAGDA